MPNSFKLRLTHFSRGKKEFARRLRPPWLRAWKHPPWLRAWKHLTGFSSDSSAGSTLRRDQARSEMSSHHLVLGRPLGHFSVGFASRTCLPNLSWDIPVTWPNNRSWDFSIRRSGSILAVRISQMHTLSLNVTPQTFLKNFISAACT